MPAEGLRSQKVRIRENLQAQVNAYRANLQRRQLAMTFVWGGAMFVFFMWATWELGYAIPRRLAALEAQTVMVTK